MVALRHDADGKNGHRARSWRDHAVAAALFAVALTAYLANGDFLPINDAKTAVYLPASLLQEGNWSFTPQEYPFMFYWRVETRRGPVLRQFSGWEHRFGRYDAQTLYEAGRLHVERAKTYLVPTVHRDVYVSTWGPGPGLCAVPLAAALRPWYPQLDAHPEWLWRVGKWSASLCVAVSVVFLFWAARMLTYVGVAFVVALSYALGTGVFSTSSQALWQHGPNELFLAAAIWALVRSENARGAGGLVAAALCGALLGAATWCRPTSALVVLSVGGYLAWVHRPRLVAFLMGGLPLAVGLLAYNLYYFDRPLAFGQMMLDHVAQNKTGATSLWQTPLWLGAAGLLISPSRGLLVYSPFLLFSLFGAVGVWRDARFRVLRPLPLAVLAVWLVEFKHFDWWGGWSFGYRHIVDTVGLLGLLLLPVLERIRRRPWLGAVFALLVAWSIGVQIVGAWAYNLSGWNARVAYDVEFFSPPHVVRTLDRAEMEALDREPGTRVKTVYMDVDLPEYRYRLWSLADSQLVYYVTHFRQAREQKRRFMKRWLEDPAL